MVFGLVICGATTLQAQQISQTAIAQIEALAAEKAARNQAQRKISSRLLFEERMRRGADIASGLSTLRRSVEVDVAGATLVDIRATVSQGLLAAIRGLGGEIINSFPQYKAIRARIPLEKLETIAALPDIHFIRPADRAITRKVNSSEGDITHGADLARSQLGIDGSGVSIGVLSDGVDERISLAASGDIPAKCPGGPPCVTYLAGRRGSGSEGTAMLEIVHDLAPGADLMFATGISGQANFAQNILDLASAGCDVIVDDIFYFSEPVFQDGVIAQAINDVVDAGVIYFSAAGNAGNLNDGTAGVWEGDFSPTAAPVAVGGTAHDFGGGTNYNTITSDPPFGITLHWSDAAGASANDYDLYLLDSTRTTVFDASTSIQNGNDDPYEYIDSGPYNDLGNTLVVVRNSGATRFIHLNTLRGELSIATDGQTAGHSAAEKAVGVAAVDVGMTGCPTCARFAGGVGNPIESFSSDGPRRIFYEENGTPVTPGNFLDGGGQLLQKPDLAAADGVATASSGFNPFFGTSAAAPHAAAIAGLLIDQDEALRGDPAAILATLSAQALDIEAVGLDRDSGAGVIFFPICGDGTLDPPEQCDDGNTSAGDCCSPTCEFEPDTTECRASADVCDVAELCTGSAATCPVDAFAADTTECRASADVCDVAELCTGSAATCPVDAFAADTTECRASADV
ncbi:MAG: S8 family serine peptidase, partial [bacterium]|nr:S8 family serine peptidase [bacterium]